MYFIALQNTYNTVDLALFHDGHLVETQSSNKLSASKQLMLSLNNLLATHQLTFSDLSFIAVNQGPGPFNTLRVVIASANGISFATKIPLVGVDGLKAFCAQYQDKKYPYTIALLNAFNNDVYFAIQQPNTDIATGYRNIEQFMQEISTLFPTQNIRFLGNGTALHEQIIKNMLGPRAIISNPTPDFCSIETIGHRGLQQWEKKENVSHELMPLYLKKHPTQQ